MSAQTFAEAFAPVEAENRRIVAVNTWGHLAPRRDKTYRGHITFAVGCFGDDPLNPTALSCEFQGLDSSPWFFDAMAEFFSNLKLEPGGVYRFQGTFRNYCFRGVTHRIKLRASPSGSR